MAVALAQTQVNLATQSKNVDFSAATSTKPVQVGSVLPALCSLGQLFFNSNAAAGQNLFGCTATNTWSPLSGGSGVGNGGGLTLASQLADFNATSAGATQTIGSSCNGANSCQLRLGAVIFSMTQPATAPLSGASGAGTAFWYLSSSQTLTVGNVGVGTIICSGCAVATGITSFPADSIPLWQTTFTSNVWDPINYGSMDKRAVFSRDVIAAGMGMTSSYNPITGVQTLSIDSTAIPQSFTGVGPPTLNCPAGDGLYTDTANLNLYFCEGGGIWKQANGAVSTRTDVENFPLAGDAPAGAIVLAAYSSVAATTFTAAGPNGIGYAVSGIPMSVNSALMLAKKASPTWNALPGTVDVAIVASNADETPAVGNWILNVYAGCAAPSGVFAYGSPSVVTGTPPGLNDFQTYQASAINLPPNCAANNPMQFWLQRMADTGGTTGINPFVISIEVVIRGN